MPVPEHQNLSAEALVNHLLETMSMTERTVQHNDNDNVCFMTEYTLVDILCSLTILEKKRKMSDTRSSSKTIHSNNTTQKLAILVVTRIDQHRAKIIRKIKPARLVDTLHALHTLELLTIREDDDAHDDFLPSPSAAAGRIHNEICRTLVLGHSLSQLSTGDMSIALTTLATAATHTQQQPQKSLPIDDSFSVVVQQSSHDLCVALMRRFRKQVVRQSASVRHLVRCLLYTSDAADE